MRCSRAVWIAGGAGVYRLGANASLIEGDGRAEGLCAKRILYFNGAAVEAAVE